MWVSYILKTVGFVWMNWRFAVLFPMAILFNKLFCGYYATEIWRSIMNTMNINVNSIKRLIPYAYGAVVHFCRTSARLYPRTLGRGIHR